MSTFSPPTMFHASAIFPTAGIACTHTESASWVIRTAEIRTRDALYSGPIYDFSGMSFIAGNKA